MMAPMRVPRRALRGLLIAAALFGADGDASAHGVLLSQGEYRFEDGVLRARAVFAAPELATSVEGVDLDGDEDVSTAELETGEARAAIERGVVGRIDVTTDSGACAGRLLDAALVPGGGVEVTAEWRCPGGVREANVRMGLLDGFDAGHRHLVTMLGTTSSDVAITTAGDESFVVSGTPRASKSFAMFLGLGVRHILEGWDHLLFLFALVLVGGHLRSLIAVVTAFTAGHSISLAAGTLGLWVPPPSWVEPLIALSIAWVGVENFLVEDASRRWRITLPFGLVHGFGFAGALRELGLARAEVPAALFGFNLGVEAGQVAVLALLLPLVLWSRRQPWFGARGLYAASGAVVVAGGTLFLARVLGWG